MKISLMLFQMVSDQNLRFSFWWPKLKINASHPGADVLKLTVFLNRHLNVPPDAEALRVFGPHFYSINPLLRTFGTNKDKDSNWISSSSAPLFIYFSFRFFWYLFLFFLDKTSVKGSFQVSTQDQDQRKLHV